LRRRCATSENVEVRLWIGIDFSGDAERWKPACSSTNVWVSRVVEFRSRLVLLEVKPIQAVAMSLHPFAWLALELRRRRFSAAAIDAPFSVPLRFVASIGHPALLSMAVSLSAGLRPFADGATFVAAVAGRKPPLDPKKPLRRTEQLWRQRRVNVRSTMWVAPRGGAPMTAACTALLGAAAAPLWPWRTARTGLVAEAFPAAQLRQWGLPYERYAGEAGRTNRTTIVESLQRRMVLGPHAGTLRGNADALDSVLCAFAARAAWTNTVVDEPDRTVGDEGWIAVHP
jgi:hypothetical protein